MTRETKIGLLVGLAFIIVIGILLSDHLTSTTEPQQAPLAQAGSNVRSGVTVPGSGAANPPITTVTSTPAVTPQQTVPTNAELTPKAPPVEIVQIGSAPAPAPVPSQQSAAKPEQPAGPAQQSKPVEIVTAQQEHPQATPVARTSDPSVPGSLANVADSVGEQLVVKEPSGGVRAQDLVAVPPAAQQQPLPAGSKKYKAEPGDNLSKLARKAYGSDSKANREAIIAANPSLQQNANLVVSGRTYVIPPAPVAAATVAAAAPAAPLAPMPVPVASSDQPAAAVALPPPAAPTATKPEYFYTVKPGDSLTRIAVEQLGSAGGVTAIKDLNQDLLKGGDIIRPNMKLRLPAKPLASAS